MNKLQQWALALGLTLAGCGPIAGPASGDSGPSESQPAAERGYVSPPAATSARRLPGDRILLTGTAAPGSRVRLASPGGAAAFAQTDRTGAWAMALPEGAEVRLFGLSAPLAGRTVQAEGYLAAPPRGLPAQLRAGSGAVVLGPLGPGVVLLAADFDRKGGTVLSGRAPARAVVSVVVDGKARGTVTADPAGRFMLPLNEPLIPGDHQIAAVAGRAHDEGTLAVSPPEPLTSGPFHAQAVGGDWRIDWLTPGGGVQSTVLFALPGAPAA